MRIVFMGSPEFALPCLVELINSPHTVAAVVTQPDRPKGRGKKLAPTPVKKMALANDIPVFQPSKINTPEFIAEIRELAPDLVVVVAFGQILKPEFLCIPPLGCINVHASLLPQYRGAAPIHWALINGEEKTGVTTMYLDAGMDTGDMILKQEVVIEPLETVGSLHDKLALAGAVLLGETIRLITSGTAPRTSQNHQEATYASLLKREHEKIVWERTACQVNNQVRGMNPWPGAYTTLNNDQIKVWQTTVHEELSTGASGTVQEIVPGHGIRVQCGSGSLWLVEIQPQGSRRMTADAFACGHRLEIGTLLGSPAE